MANQDHVDFLKQGVEAWNQWMNENEPWIVPDLEGIDLRKRDLRFANFHSACFLKADLREACLSKANLSLTYFREANLRNADLREANLQGAWFIGADLREANLCDADLSDADLRKADLSNTRIANANLEGTNLTSANLTAANLSGANLTAANLSGTNLSGSSLIQTSLEQTDLRAARVYGISVWDIKTDKKTKQSNLIVTPQSKPAVYVDDLEVAQFIYLLLNRKKLRNILNTITSKAVLLLGRFTPERKATLDAMADELRKHDFLPIIFDFEHATGLDFTETIKVLAGLSLFVIVDVTKPKSVPQELQATVPGYQKPFILIMQEGEEPYAILSDFKKYDWVLKPLLKYPTREKLISGFKRKIIDRAWEKHKEIQRQKNDDLEAESIEDFMEERENLLDEE